MSVVVAASLLAACAGSSTSPESAVDTGADTTETAPTPTTGPAAATTQPASSSSTSAPTVATSAPPPPASSAPELADDDLIELVAALSADELRGRDNLTPEAEATRQLLLPMLAAIAEPWNPAEPGDAGYLQSFDAGTNLLGIIRGTELADEYVMIGAHYDHLTDCRSLDGQDQICNGAADNAAGVAAVFEIAEALASAGTRRSVIVALWDAEEDGLLGAKHFVSQPVVALDQIVTYLNFDIQGTRLIPSLAQHTFAIGAETGGPGLAALVAEVTGASDLTYAMFSLVIGQGRSDHAPLAGAGVPVVFFTDANNGCYHTSDDELAVLDTDKLRAQVATAGVLASRVANDDLAIEFDAAAPLSTFADAQGLGAIADLASADLDLFAAAAQVEAQQAIESLQAVAAAGQAAYDADAQAAMFGAAAGLVDLLANSDCALALA